MSHTCGKCKWWISPADKERGFFPDDKRTVVGECSAICIAFRHPKTPACPAFDDGSYDKAVDELIAVVGSVDWTNVRAMIDFMKQGPNYWPYADRQLRPFTENIRPAIAAVKKAREERGK